MARSIDPIDPIYPSIRPSPGSPQTAPAVIDTGERTEMGWVRHH
jgi:hypothetical protein